MASPSYSDVGILTINGSFNRGDIVNFQVPGSTNGQSFRYRFPRKGSVTGFAMTGTKSTDDAIAAYVSRHNMSTQNYDDVLTPDKTSQTIKASDFEPNGYLYACDTPIVFQKGDTLEMKFVAQGGSMSVNLGVFVNVSWS